MTARYGSRMHDDAKIDLINIPFNVQAKNGIQRGLNPSKELKAMVTEINKRFPKYSPEHSNINIVIHRKPAQSNKRLPEDTLVIMSLDDFMKLIKISNDSPSE